MNHTLIIAILFAGIISYSLKALPLLIHRHFDLKHKYFIQFLDYASCCIFGQIIYAVGFNNASISTLIHSHNPVYLVNLVAILCAFLICLKTKSIMKSIIYILPVYAIVIFVLN